jgi:hypothetical protein
MDRRRRTVAKDGKSYLLPKKANKPFQNLLSVFGSTILKKSLAILTLWCGVALLVARRLAVRQARVRFSARHHREVFPTELTSGEEMERDLGERRRIFVYCMNVIE